MECKKLNRTKYVFKIWFNQSGKSSIVDVQLGSKYDSVSITLHLTFSCEYSKSFRNNFFYRTTPVAAYQN